ncbi:MAG: iron-containing alcohol dehydrogenase [Candidatus Hodarchaeales archaeon]|jgi:glycerol-1-phosphate dehydrogenase [NAD(P)+]
MGIRPVLESEVFRHFVIGRSLADRLVPLIQSFDLKKKGLIVTGIESRKIMGQLVEDLLSQLGYDLHGFVVKNGTINESKELSKLITKDLDFILAIGGGKAIDVTKYATVIKGTSSNLVFIPTTPSHDGIASPCIYLKEERGSQEMYLGMSQAPLALIADISIISKARNRLFSSGVADSLSTLTSTWDWELAYRLRNVNFSEYAAMVARTNGEIILRHINTLKLGNMDSLQLSLKSLIISGFLIAIANNNRVSHGSEHLFAQALDVKEPGKSLHGERCGVGTILMAALQGQDWKLIQQALKTVRSPVTAKELNVRTSSVIEALIDSHEVDPRHPIYTILGGSGLTEEAAWNLAIKTGVVGSGLE